MRHGINQTPSNATSDSARNQLEAGSPVSLRRTLPAGRLTVSEDVQISSVADSSATAKPGDLIVYRIGKDDPAKLVAQAMARGAAAILTEQLLPCPVPQCIVGDVDLAMASITAELLGRPDRKVLTIGVIGSAGKTTTSLLLSTLLRASGVRAGFQTDLGTHDGVVQVTAPESLSSGSELVTWIGEAADAGSQAVVVELSDDEARYGHYDSIEFDMVVVTGSAISGNDFGPNGLACVLERLADDGVVVAPADDPRAMRVIEEHDVRYVSYGVRKAADVTAKIIDHAGGMTTLLVTYHDTTAVMETSLCGGAMAANHAAAIAVGLLLDQPLYEAIEKISTLRTVPGRGQRLARYGHASVVMDVAGTPERAAASLRTFRGMKGAGRLWCVMAVDCGEQPEILAHYGNLIERFADQAIVTAQPGTRKSFMPASHAVLDGVEKCAVMRLVADRSRAIKWAISEAGPNDTILVMTGERNQTAKAGRTDLQKLEKMIEGEWDKADEANPKPTLKIFG
ncbi:MAG: Mur ligase family protein [Rubripirellula sp.]